jgi:hypothetical protein
MLGIITILPPRNEPAKIAGANRHDGDTALGLLFGQSNAARRQVV